jgi:hypothetical protein
MTTSRFLLTLTCAILAALLLIGLFAWAPWITEARAARIVESWFITEWMDVMDGCGFNCSGCGVQSVRDVPFGAVVELEYACGLLPADDPQYHTRSSHFVSFLGIVQDE